MSVEIYITQDEIISGIITGSINYTFTRDKDNLNRIMISGEADRLTLPSKFEGIYGCDIDKDSVFDIVIKQDEQEVVLKDVYIWPRPDCYFHKDVVVIDRFEFRSW